MKISLNTLEQLEFLPSKDNPNVYVLIFKKVKDNIFDLKSNDLSADTTITVTNQMNNVTLETVQDLFTYITCIRNIENKFNK